MLCSLVLFDFPSLRVLVLFIYEQVILRKGAAVFAFGELPFGFAACFHAFGPGLIPLDLFIGLSSWYFYGAQ